MTRILCAFAILLGLLLPAAVPAQDSEQNKTAPAPAGDIFSGTVTVLQPDSLTVVRKVTGQPAVTRTFVLDSKTRIEGRLKARARVTVRFVAGADEGLYTAIYIIVR
jgi:hypothetical protein